MSLVELRNKLNWIASLQTRSIGEFQHLGDIVNEVDARLRRGEEAEKALEIIKHWVDIGFYYEEERKVWEAANAALKAYDALKKKA